MASYRRGFKGMRPYPAREMRDDEHDYHNYHDYHDYHDFQDFSDFHNHDMARFEATYVPGHDDFSMPQVIAPAPRRVISGVQQQMDDGLERMELEAGETVKSARGERAEEYVGHQPSADHEIRPEWETANRVGTRDRFAANLPGRFEPLDGGATDSAMDLPSFSPYPKVKGENVPPNEEQREDILRVARESVLHSDDFRIQLDWARDVLSHVEAASDARTRAWRREGGKMKKGERPRTPAAQHDLRVDAVNIVKFLAEQGHPDATFIQGKWLELGKFGYGEDRKEAYALYTRAAEGGNGRAEYRIGMLYENAKNMDQAIYHYSKGVQLADSASRYRIGMMQLLGQQRFAKDVVTALGMIEESADTADSDSPQGAYMYGLMIAREVPDLDLSETVLPPDLLLARQYMEKAAHLGFAKAQLKMGQAYELCQLGCRFDAALSLHYYGLAAKQGQAEAALGASRWFLFGYDGAFSKDERLAFLHAQDAADAGLATGEFALGYYYEIGVHVPRDLDEAKRWYSLAAEHGNGDAQDRIEQLGQSKTLTKKDHETTTLTRIKSMHASQRGKRPDRFTRAGNTMPSVSETRADASPSPRSRPTMYEPRLAASTDRPDGTNREPADWGRPTKPAFMFNPDSGLAMRPKSALPYPEDEMTASYKVRSRSTAPHPEAEIGRKPASPYHGRMGPRMSTGLGAEGQQSSRASQSLQADWSTGAFGIHTASPGYGADMQSHGRPLPSPAPGWDARIDPGYRRPIPGAAVSQASYGPGPGYSPALNGPPADARTRIQRSNPQPGHDKARPLPAGPPAAQSYTAPGRRPASDTYGRSTLQGGLPASASTGSLRDDTATPTRKPITVPMLVPVLAHTNANASSDGGRSSTQPGSGSERPSPQPGPVCGGMAKMKTNTANSDGKTTGQGPATFEEMGIPKGKDKDDCVLM